LAAIQAGPHDRLTLSSLNANKVDFQAFIDNKRSDGVPVYGRHDNGAAKAGTEEIPVQI
jgi:hypothetical protein